MRFSLISFLVLWACFTGASVVHSANLDTGFSSIRSQVVWPVQGADSQDIASTFGPRIKFAQNRYDWHRGIDIPAPYGTEVRAAFEGTLHQITTYPEGGFTVVIKHRLPQAVNFHTTSTHVFYTFSMHLSQVDSQLQQAYEQGQKPLIRSGDRIGYVGSSGEGIVTNHLHFELRLGTPCSLEYQLTNPTSSCAKGFGFDPHIHPLHLLSSSPTDATISQVQALEQGRDGLYQITTQDFSPGLVQFELTFLQDNGALLYEHVLHLDTRAGFDARSVAALDTQDKTKPYLEPKLFNVTSTMYEIAYRIPASIFSRVSGAKQMRLRVTDYLGSETVFARTFTAAAGCSFAPGSLYKLPSDFLPDTQHDTAVYYYGADCKRHAFPNEQTYFSWFKDFSQVQELSVASMASIPLGANVRFKPGTIMVKLQTVPDVYAVTGYGVLTWVAREEDAISIFGATWAKQVRDLSDAFAVDYQFNRQNRITSSEWNSVKNTNWNLP